MRHGWTTHGQPCCPQAPVVARPDEVTACANTWATGAGCAECQTCAEILHGWVPVAMEWEFPILSQQDWERAAARWYFGPGSQLLNPNYAIKVNWTSS